MGAMGQGSLAMLRVQVGREAEQVEVWLLKVLSSFEALGVWRQALR